MSSHIHNNNDSFFFSASPAVTLLSQMMLVAGRTDFSLNKRKSEDQPVLLFEYLRYPDSFKACLVQLANHSWKSFNTASQNMGAIKLLMDGLPLHMRRALQVLLNKSNMEVESLLLVQFNKIKKTIQSCINCATEMEDAFISLLAIFAELLEAILGQHNEQYGSLITKCQQARVLSEKKRLQETHNLQKMQQLVSENVTLLQNVFVERQRSGISVTIMDDAIGKVQSSLSEGLMSLVNDARSSYCSGKSFDLREVVSLLDKITNENGKLDSNKVNANVTELYVISASLSMEITRLGSSNADKNDKQFKEVISVLQSASQLLQGIIGISSLSQTEVQGKETKLLTEHIKQNKKSLKSLLKKKPNILDEIAGTDSIVNDFESGHTQSNNEPFEIVNYLLDQVESEHILDVLIRTTKLLFLLQENCSELVILLTKIRNLIIVTADTNLKMFAAVVKDKANISNQSWEVTLPELLKNQIVLQTSSANKGIHYVLRTASCYCFVSDKYLMHRMSRLSHIMVLEFEKDRREMEELQEAVLNECETVLDEMQRHNLEYNKVDVCLTCEDYSDT